MDKDDFVTPPFTLGRLTALFERGETLEFKDAQGAFYVYVAALTSSQREEAILDGAVVLAAARILHDDNSDQTIMLRHELEEANRDEVIERLLQSRSVDATNLAVDDLQADEKWIGDRLLLLERGDALMKSGVEIEDVDWQKLVDLNAEYVEDLKTHALTNIRRFKEDYDSWDKEKLTEKFVSTWSENRCFTAQMAAYRATQLFYSCRKCSAKILPTGGFSHENCGGHVDRIFPSKESISTIPQEFLDVLAPAVYRMDSEGSDALKK